MSTSVEQFRSHVLPKLLEIYSISVDEARSSDKQVSLRLDLREDQVDEFKKKYSLISNTDWIIYRNNCKRQKVDFSKIWICQHSKLKKKNLKRNTDCKAKLSVTIKKVTEYTKKRDKFLKMTPPLKAEVTITLDHTHNTDSAEALRMLRINDDTKQAFYEYFQNGLTPAQSMHFHENKFILEEDFIGIANAATNPTKNQVYYLHDCWRQHNLGSQFDPIEKLKEKIKLYESVGASVHFTDNQDNQCWALALATPVMKRAQELSCSKEIIFTDTTSGCEATSSSMTIILTASNVGAIPLAVLIHSAQTKDSYEEAFLLLKQNFPLCFGGRDHPAIFMTDDSAAEKAALKAVWPESEQLLCHFHVAQAEWRWIFTHNIQVQDRPYLMKLFQSVMYAATEADLSNAYSSLIAVSSKYPQFVSRFLNFFDRRKEWVLYYRNKLLTRKHNTNNLAEATIRILKDVVLCRTKAYNIVALAEFCITVWEHYLIKKLLDFAYSRKTEGNALYRAILNRTSNLKEEDLEEIDNETYQIKSGSNLYTINTDIGVCTCPAGVSGAFCKHQGFLMELKKIHLPNAPALNQEEKYKFAKIALGSSCPEEYSFFRNFDSQADIINEDSEEIDLTACTSIIPALPNVLQSPSTSSQLHISASEDSVKLLAVEFRRLNELISRGVSQESVSRWVNALGRIKTTSDFEASFVLKKPKQHQLKKIRVQPTSIARRRVGITHSSRRVPSGRPPQRIAMKTKRKRSLSFNVERNQANAKSHGAGH